METQEFTTPRKQNSLLIIVSIVGILLMILVFFVGYSLGKKATNDPFQETPTPTPSSLLSPSLSPSPSVIPSQPTYKNTRGFTISQVKQGTSDILLVEFNGQTGIYFGNDWSRVTRDEQGKDIFNPQNGLFINQQSQYTYDVNLSSVTVIHHIHSSTQFIPTVLYSPAYGSSSVFYLLFGYMSDRNNVYHSQSLYEVSTDFSQPMKPLWQSGVLDGKKYTDAFRLVKIEAIHPKYLAVYFGACNECDSADIAGTAVINLETKAEKYLHKAANVSYNVSVGEIMYQSIARVKVSCVEDDRECEVDGTKFVNEPSGDPKFLALF